MGEPQSLKGKLCATRIRPRLRAGLDSHPIGSPQVHVTLRGGAALRLNPSGEELILLQGRQLCRFRPQSVGQGVVLGGFARRG